MDERMRAMLYQAKSDRQGLLFQQADGSWVAGFHNGFKVLIVEVEFDPWTGEKLEGRE